MSLTPSLKALINKTIPSPVFLRNPELNLVPLFANQIMPAPPVRNAKPNATIAGANIAIDTANSTKDTDETTIAQDKTVIAAAKAAIYIEKNPPTIPNTVNIPNNAAITPTPTHTFGIDAISFNASDKITNAPATLISAIAPGAAFLRNFREKTIIANKAPTAATEAINIQISISAIIF